MGHKDRLPKSEVTFIEVSLCRNRISQDIPISSDELVRQRAEGFHHIWLYAL